MADVFQVKVIKPEELNVGAFEKAIESGLDDGAKIVEKSFDETQSTFKRKAPIKIKKGRGVRLIWVDSAIYSYISHGTSIRWALMSRDWKSKTSPGRFKPGRGRGRVVIAGRRAMQRRGIRPRPGIKARNYPEKIIKRDAARVQTAMNKQIDKAARRAF